MRAFVFNNTHTVLNNMLSHDRLLLPLQLASDNSGEDGDKSNSESESCYSETEALARVQLSVRPKEELGIGQSAGKTA